MFLRKKQEPLAWLWQEIHSRTLVPKGFEERSYNRGVENALVELSSLVQEKKLYIRRLV